MSKKSIWQIWHLQILQKIIQRLKITQANTIRQKPRVLLAFFTKPKILTLLFYTLFALFGLFALSISTANAQHHTKPAPATFPQYECLEPKKFSKIQRDNIIYAYNFGAPHGMGYTLAAIAWQESCAGVYMMNFSDPSAGLYHAHIPVVLKYYSKYEDNAFTRNVMGQMLIDNRLFASQIALDTLLYWQKYHKGNHKNTIKSYNKGFKWQKDKENNTLAESYYNNITKKIRALESYIPRYSRVKNQSLFVELEDKNKQLQQTFKTLQNAKKIPQTLQPPKTTESKQESNQESQNTTTNTKQESNEKQNTQQPPKQAPKTQHKKLPNTLPMKPFIEPKKDAQNPNQKFNNDDFIELPISPSPLSLDTTSPNAKPQTKLANNHANQNPKKPSSNSQKLKKLDELFDDFNIVFEGN